MGAAVAPPSARASAERRPAWWRVPFLVLGFVALFVGIGAGLARLGYPMPGPVAALAGLHGPLMVLGFFGVVIALERAVAIGRAWAYVAPALAGAGTVSVLAGETSLAAWLYCGGAAVLLAASLDVLRRQRALFVYALALAAACLVVGVAAWAAGASVHAVVPWWLAFLIVTIAGERLELSRFMPPSPRAQRVFGLVLALIVLSMLAAARWDWGIRGFGIGLLALALWLFRHDVARRTVRQRGLTRFIAVCLLSGYVWLAVAGAVMVAAGALQPGAPAYDAALHAVLLGFVFAMVFGHAPIIFPAVLRVAVPYHPAFYLPLALLHLGLLLRLAGDAGAGFAVTRSGGLLAAVALLAFVVGTASAVVRGRLTAKA